MLKYDISKGTQVSIDDWPTCLMQPFAYGCNKANFREELFCRISWHTAHNKNVLCIPVFYKLLHLCTKTLSVT